MALCFKTSSLFRQPSYYRDLKNVIDTAIAEGESKGKIEMARNAIAENISLPIIMRLTAEKIENLKNK